MLISAPFLEFLSANKKYVCCDTSYKAYFLIEIPVGISSSISISRRLKELENSVAITRFGQPIVLSILDLNWFSVAALFVSSFKAFQGLTILFEKKLNRGRQFFTSSLLYLPD